MTLQIVRAELARRGFHFHVGPSFPFPLRFGRRNMELMAPQQLRKRQLRKKIKEWRLEKNVKAEEMRKIARNRQWRLQKRGVEPCFTKNGVLINPSNIGLWIKGHPLSPILSEFCFRPSGPVTNIF
jgi:hypothetical protein